MFKPKEVIVDGREGSKEGQEVRLWMRKEINAQGQTVYFFYFYYCFRRVNQGSIGYGGTCE